MSLLPHFGKTELVKQRFQQVMEGEHTGAGGAKTGSGKVVERSQRRRDSRVQGSTDI